MLRKYHNQLGRLHVRASDLLLMHELDWPSLTELHVQGLREQFEVERLLQVVMPNLQKLCLNDFELAVDQLVHITSVLCNSTHLNIFRLASGIIYDFKGRLELFSFASPTLRALEVEHCRQPGTYDMRSFSFLNYFPFLENLHVYWRAVSDPKEMPTATRDFYMRPDLEKIRHRATADRGILYPRGYPRNVGRTRGKRDFQQYVTWKAKTNVNSGSDILRIEEYLYSGKMCNSNIWMVMPKLKQFTFHLALDTVSTDQYDKLRTPGSVSLSETIMLYRSSMSENSRPGPLSLDKYISNLKRTAWRGLRKVQVEDSRKLRKVEKELLGYIKSLTGTLAETNKQMMEKMDHVESLSRKISLIVKRNEVEFRPVSNSSSAKGIVSPFPGEVWERILQNLTHWNDMENCSNVCDLFERILHPCKGTFMFHKIFPHLYKFLDRREILQCRSTCKAWSHAVDDFFENHDFFRPYTHMKQGCESRYPSFINPVIEKGLDELYANAWGRSVYRDGGYIFMRNPFIGRTLLIDPRRYGSTPNMQKYLQVYGKHVYYLNLDNLLGDGVYEVVAHNLNNHLLPNLRKIGLDQYNFAIRITEPCFFPALETIQLGTNYVGYSERVHSFLQQHHLQLGRLELNTEQWSSICHLDWPTLSELHISTSPCYRVVSISQLYPRYIPVASMNTLLLGKLPNLQKLGLPFLWIKNGELIDVIRKVSVTSRLNTVLFRTTFGDKDKLAEIVDGCVLTSSTLKTIEIELDIYFMPDWRCVSTFLLRFPLLENLRVFCKGKNYLRRDNDENQLVSRWKCYRPNGSYPEDALELRMHLLRNEMFKSNIWELMPRLKVFTFQNQVYTRQRYDWLKGQEERK